MERLRTGWVRMHPVRQRTGDSDWRDTGRPRLRGNRSSERRERDQPRMERPDRSCYATQHQRSSARQRARDPGVRHVEWRLDRRLRRDTARGLREPSRHRLHQPHRPRLSARMSRRSRRDRPGLHGHVPPRRRPHLRTEHDVLGGGRLDSVRGRCVARGPDGVGRDGGSDPRRSRREGVRLRATPDRGKAAASARTAADREDPNRACRCSETPPSECHGHGHGPRDRQLPQRMPDRYDCSPWYQDAVDLGHAQEARYLEVSPVCRKHRPARPRSSAADSQGEWTASGEAVRAPRQLTARTKLSPAR